MRWQLHGVLADDMGLGKTLQTICIIASDHHNRRTEFKKTGLPAHSPLPSMVVCPPTLVGHWAHEVEKFVGSQMKTVQVCPRSRQHARSLCRPFDEHVGRRSILGIQRSERPCAGTWRATVW